MMAQNYVSKHVVDLVRSGVYTFWCMWSWFYKLTIRLVHEDQLQLPRDLHKGCVPRSFKGIEFFLSQNFPKLNSVQLFFLSYAREKITKLCFEISSKCIKCSASAKDNRMTYLFCYFYDSFVYLIPSRSFGSFLSSCVWLYVLYTFV